MDLEGGAAVEAVLPAQGDQAGDGALQLLVPPVVPEHTGRPRMRHDVRVSRLHPAAGESPVALC